MRSIDLQGHRGARGLRPENTLAAFEHALTIGVTTLELDVGMTRDGVLVVHHDLRLNPDIARDQRAGGWITAPGPLLWSLSAAELARYDVGRINPASAYAQRFPLQQACDGERIPALHALFARTAALGASAIRFNIETKVNPERPADTAPPEVMTGALIAAIRGAGCGARATVQSFDWRTLRQVQREAPEITTVYLTSEQPEENTVAAVDGRPSAWTAGVDARDHPHVVAMVHAAGGTVWSPDFRDLTEDKLHAASALRMRVVPWTVNSPEDLARVLAMEVDGVISDYPDRAAALIRQRGWTVR